MTDEQIIKAMQCVIGNGVDCTECEYQEVLPFPSCMRMCAKNALNLINRQKAEIERLKDENKSIRYCYEQAKSYNDTLAESCEKNCKHFNMTTRAEAIKKFAERLKEKKYKSCEWSHGEHPYVVEECDIDNLVKEMTEGKNG